MTDKDWNKLWICFARECTGTIQRMYGEDGEAYAACNKCGERYEVDIKRKNTPPPNPDAPFPPWLQENYE